MRISFFPQLPDKLVFAEMLSKTFPLGGRCPSAHTGADEGLTHRRFPSHRIRSATSNLSPFIVPAEEISTLPLIRHGLAVPPSPEGEGHAFRYPCKHQFTGLLGETDVYILLYRIFPLCTRGKNVNIPRQKSPGSAGRCAGSPPSAPEGCQTSARGGGNGEIPG